MENTQVTACKTLVFENLSFKDFSSFRINYKLFCDQYHSEIVLTKADASEICLQVVSNGGSIRLNKTDLYFSAYNLFRNQIPEKLRLAIML